MKIVLDTNVLVSALLIPQSTSAKILDLIATNRLELLVDDRILSEYREVLRRPKFQFDESLIDDLISYLDRFGTYIQASTTQYLLPDPDDISFLEVALSGEAEFIVTGNKKDFGKTSVNIVSPSDFLKIFQRS